MPWIKKVSLWWVPRCHIVAFCNQLQSFYSPPESPPVNNWDAAAAEAATARGTTTTETDRNPLALCKAFVFLHFYIFCIVFVDMLTCILAHNNNNKATMQAYKGTGIGQGLRRR